jgi:hypothetical protein
MLIFRFTDSTKRRAETDPDTVLRVFARIFESGIVEGEFSRSDRELGVAIQALETLWREELFRIPIKNFTAATNMKSLGIETGDPSNSGFLRSQALPEVLHTASNGGNGTQAGDNGAAFHLLNRKGHGGHEGKEKVDFNHNFVFSVLFVVDSKYAFMQRNVLLAT